jgi:hypothetical protein
MQRNLRAWRGLASESSSEAKKPSALEAHWTGVGFELTSAISFQIPSAGFTQTANCDVHQQ